EAVEEPFEMFEADPWTPPYSLSCDEIFEGDLNAVHRPVMENDKVNNNRSN
ncbi:MAG: hypothetical protein K0Q73_5746, partial [Paenibacillus sp.]|nr:hypothetical protein [Paenibacillus sp.]